ncbi:hypothetical protein NRS6186_10855 [Bacillus subtilis]|nr:hypothetical protein NRS6127_03805 [Bacillus subtilis]CAF1897425.1 hypothetical protein NRS6186_03821 [Bacillus subtilis]CAI6270834.1 hypothetical protein NRS6127_10760 [Bacillus subtilis]CAI6271972.1 hypothetical protein NRS6186_10855 [Bacillus subtilis]
MKKKIACITKVVMQHIFHNSGCGVKKRGD